MISINNISKFYPSKLGPQYVFKGLNFAIPADHNIALLGKNGAGKSTLFRLLACSEYPDKGKINSNLSISWPVALTTGIHPRMTGRENTRFIGRVNGVANLDEYEQQVQRFAELKLKYDLPVRTYSSGMRSRLSFACCMAINFDLYLIDEVTAVGDPKFKQKAKKALLEKSKHANVIMASHELDDIRMFCDSAIVINDGQLSFYSDLEQAIATYQAM